MGRRETATTAMEASRKVRVQDVSRSVAFYRDVLGLPVALELPGRLLASRGQAAPMLPAGSSSARSGDSGQLNLPNSQGGPAAAGKGAVRWQRSRSPTWAHRAPWSTP